MSFNEWNDVLLNNDDKEFIRLSSLQQVPDFFIIDAIYNKSPLAPLLVDYIDNIALLKLSDNADNTEMIKILKNKFYLEETSYENFDKIFETKISNFDEYLSYDYNESQLIVNARIYLAEKLNEENENDDEDNIDNIWDEFKHIFKNGIDEFKRSETYEEEGDLDIITFSGEDLFVKFITNMDKDNDHFTTSINYKYFAKYILFLNTKKSSFREKYFTLIDKTITQEQKTKLVKNYPETENICINLASMTKFAGKI